jgi:MoxR-like ATPase
MGEVARLEYGVETVKALGDAVVGRMREIEVVVAALMSGRHLLLEGPPGTGKSTLLRSIAEASGHAMEFCEGNADLTPARLSGHFDPAQVLEAGYVKEIWIDGPLTRALIDGSLLYLEEINRVPEETLNLLVTVMSEGELTIPRLGRITAHADFRFVAAMNPFDAVGTARISGAIYDRVCRVAMDYQSDSHEREIASRSSHAASASPSLVAKSVALVRATRSHPDLRVGSSVRGAIDLVMLATELALLRGPSADPAAVNLDAALCALSGRVQVQDGVTRTAEDIITDLFESTFADHDGAPEEASDGDADEPGKVSGRPMTATPPRQQA